VQWADVEGDCCMGGFELKIAALLILWTGVTVARITHLHCTYLQWPWCQKRGSMKA